MSTAALAEIDPPPELEQHVAACVQWSQANAIATPDQFQATADHLKEIKRAQKAADDFFDPIAKQAYELHRGICARKKLLTDPLAHSERVDKAKMLDFQRAEDAKAETERRRLQAEADEAARREREALEKRAAAAKKPETQERLREQAASVVAPVVAVASAAPKLSGVSTRKAWKAEIVDLEKFLAFCCEAKRVDLLLPNMKSIEGMAKALKERASLPGVKFFEVESMAASSR